MLSQGTLTNKRGQLSKRERHLSKSPRKKLTICCVGWGPMWTLREHLRLPGLVGPIAWTEGKCSEVCPAFSACLLSEESVNMNVERGRESPKLRAFHQAHWFEGIKLEIGGYKGSQGFRAQISKKMEVGLIFCRISLPEHLLIPHRHQQKMQKTSRKWAAGGLRIWTKFSPISRCYNHRTWSSVITKRNYGFYWALQRAYFRK